LVLDLDAATDYWMLDSRTSEFLKTLHLEGKFFRQPLVIIVQESSDVSLQPHKSCIARVR
jgi:hypothetical protein